MRSWLEASAWAIGSFPIPPIRNERRDFGDFSPDYFVNPNSAPTQEANRTVAS